MKKEININNFATLLHPFQSTLITTMGSDKKPNIIAIAWIMPVSHSPPALVFAIRKERYSFKLLQENQAFAVNFPMINLKDEVLFCGTKSGKMLDKFKETGLTQGQSKLIDVPIIEECVAHIECSVKEILQEGLDHMLVIGNILTCYADSEYFDKKWKVDKVNLLLHLGGDTFTTNDSKVLETKNK
jgi:flavin reductase (DIM6/NTAB) family NADH-FMN oxidoreductase RutF